MMGRAKRDNDGKAKCGEKTKRSSMSIGWGWGREGSIHSFLKGYLSIWNGGEGVNESKDRSRFGAVC
jgi:hypothetical protein